jgi:hypothetical protein
VSVADDLINDIVSSSQIPWGTRRQAVLRELRSHVEDYVVAAREAGHPDDEIQRMVLASLGDPHQIARNFAWVCRHERTVFRISVFVFSTLTVASLLAGAVFTMQAGVAAGFGLPVPNILASRHTVIEALDILSTVAAYVGFLSLEKLFARRKIQKALALLTLCFALAFAGCAVANAHPFFLVFGFVNGVFLRTMQAFIRTRLARAAVVVACFALFGFISFQLWSSAPQYALAANCVSWFIMGAGYQVMTDLATYIDSALFSGLQCL